MAAWDLHMAVSFIRQMEEHFRDCSLRAAGAAYIADLGVALQQHAVKRRGMHQVRCHRSSCLKSLDVSKSA